MKRILLNLSSVFLLLLFAFSITPKITLHNIFANHKDSFARQGTKESSSEQLDKIRFHCDCDNLVVQSPFLSYDLNFANNSIYNHSQKVKDLRSVLLATSGPTEALRGPPIAE